MPYGDDRIACRQSSNNTLLTVAFFLHAQYDCLSDENNFCCLLIDVIFVLCSGFVLLLSAPLSLEVSMHQNKAVDVTHKPSGDPYEAV